ncbi:MAG TPA: glycerophosphodiester phosphodiesterase family protein [Chromatiaceae bacterium]|nr:glycerophosphodiester phosphodiesterase family protein [Chromatiaceae bacterium]
MHCRAKVAVVAHRGASREAPENTLSAIRLAIAQGVDACEVDVQATADGVLVLLHDEDLARVARDPRPVWGLTYAEVQRLDAGAWFSPDFGGEPIPRLEQVLDLAQGHIALNLELKFTGPDQDLARRVTDLVRAAGMGGSCLLTSQSLPGLRPAQALGLPIGWVLESEPGDPATLDLDALSLQTHLATPALVGACRRAGVETHVWTVNREAEMRRLIDLGVTAIITDAPVLLRHVLDGAG